LKVIADGRLANAGHLLFAKPWALYFIAILDLITKILAGLKLGI